jgi:hypothetical protein
MYIPLARSAQAAGVRLHPHTRATRLFVDEAGGVVGLEALTMRDAPPLVRRRFASAASIAAKPGIYYPPLRRRMERQMQAIERRFGRTIKIGARRGVVLSAGGYIANTEIVGHYAPAFRGACVTEYEAVVRFDRGLKHLVVLGQGRPHRFGIGFPPTGRSLDVDEQERHHAHRRVPRGHAQDVTKCPRQVANRD